MKFQFLHDKLKYDRYTTWRDQTNWQHFPYTNTHSPLHVCNFHGPWMINHIFFLLLPHTLLCFSSNLWRTFLSTTFTKHAVDKPRRAIQPAHTKKFSSSLQWKIVKINILLIEIILNLVLPLLELWPFSMA